VEDTPLTLWFQGIQWETLTGSLARNTVQLPIRELSFHLQDPRVVFIPVSAAESQKLGGKVYRISNTPFKFQDAVLVGAGEGYYGECKFEIDLSAPAYLKLDRSVLKGLFGKFNPSRGDLRSAYRRVARHHGEQHVSAHLPPMRRHIQLRTGRARANTGSTLAALYSVCNKCRRSCRMDRW
jgi:hypothetical protein